jgi:hypothetical protein
VTAAHAAVHEGFREPAVGLKPAAAQIIHHQTGGRSIDPPARKLGGQLAYRVLTLSQQSYRAIQRQAVAAVLMCELVAVLGGCSALRCD